MVPGADENDFFDEILRFDPSSDSISIEALKLPTRRSDIPCVENSANNRIYCFGGIGYPGYWEYYDDIVEFVPN